MASAGIARRREPPPRGVTVALALLVVVSSAALFWVSGWPSGEGARVIAFPETVGQDQQLRVPGSVSDLQAQGFVPGEHYNQVDASRVVKVIDGDTFDLGGAVTGFGDVRVRLYGAGTPEHGEPGYAEAGAFLQAMLGDSSVIVLVRGPRPEGPHGRALRYVFTVSNEGELRSVARSLVSAGCAEPWQRDGQYRDAIKRAAWPVDAQACAVATENAIWRAVAR